MWRVVGLCRVSWCAVDLSLCAATNPASILPPVCPPGSIDPRWSCWRRQAQAAPRRRRVRRRARPVPRMVLLRRVREEPRLHERGCGSPPNDSVAYSGNILLRMIANVITSFVPLDSMSIPWHRVCWHLFIGRILFHLPACFQVTCKKSCKICKPKVLAATSS